MDIGVKYMDGLKIESNNNTMITESINVLTTKKNVSTAYENYKTDYEDMKGKWKGSAAAIYLKYAENMHGAIDSAIASSDLFGNNVKTFAKKSREIDEQASINSIRER